jgi:hypothetical protein
MLVSLCVAALPLLGSSVLGRPVWEHPDELGLELGIVAPEPWGGELAERTESIEPLLWRRQQNETEPGK